MTGPARLAETADQVIGSYLAAVAARLTGPPTARRDILDELGAGVADAAETYRGAHLPRPLSGVSRAGTADLPVLKRQGGRRNQGKPGSPGFVTRIADRCPRYRVGSDPLSWR